MRGSDKETGFKIKSTNRRRKKMRGPGAFLDKESPIQGAEIDFALRVIRDQTGADQCPLYLE